MKRHFSFLALVFALMAALPARAADEVLVSAAASLKDALAELAPLCANQTGVTLTPNLASSGVLAKQIEAGAPADLFISADETTMDTLDKGGFLEAGSRTDLLSNALVLVVPVGSNLTITSAKSLVPATVKRIAIGDIASVPAGRYAVELLKSQGVYEDVKDRLVPLENVRAVLAAVESGNAEVGIVYKSDATASTKSKVAWAVPAAISPKIVYPLAVMKKSKVLVSAMKVREFLLSDKARVVFVKWGFAPPPAPAKAASANPAK